MAIPLRQSTAATVVIGRFVDSTDGVTPETALTITQADVRLSKNWGTWAQKSDTSSCTHQEAGFYSCALNATDTNTLGPLLLAVNESGAAPVEMAFMILPSAVYDALYAGTGNGVRADIQAIATGAITSAAFTAGAVNAAAMAADVVNDIWMGNALTESYAADGSAATPAQLLYMIWSALAQYDISGTTITARQLNGTSAAMTFTLDSSASPTSRTRAT